MVELTLNNKKKPPIFKNSVVWVLFLNSYPECSKKYIFIIHISSISTHYITNLDKRGISSIKITETLRSLMLIQKFFDATHLNFSHNLKDALNIFRKSIKGDKTVSINIYKWMAGFRRNWMVIYFIKKPICMATTSTTKGNYTKALICLNTGVFIMHYLLFFLYETFLHQNGKLPKVKAAPKCYSYKS